MGILAPVKLSDKWFGEDGGSGAGVCATHWGHQDQPQISLQRPRSGSFKVTSLLPSHKEGSWHHKSWQLAASDLDGGSPLLFVA